MEHVSVHDLEKVEIRVGTIIEALDLAKARVPAYVLKLDFGPFGTKKSSAQITDLYTKEELVGVQVIAVVNFKEKQVGSVISQCLVTGFPDENGRIVLAATAEKVPNGTLVR